MERKINDKFEHDGMTLKVVKATECTGCYFNDIDDTCMDACDIMGSCSGLRRKDKTDVKFITINPMRTPEEWAKIANTNSRGIDYTIEQIQKEAYNQALEDAVKNVLMFPNGGVDFGHLLDKQSILKLKL